jgi:hypothetical protein
LSFVHAHLEELVSIDGSQIDAVPTMQFADDRSGVKKAKVHLGLELNRGLSGQTGVMDRCYQCHKNFDQWQVEDRHFVCRIRKSTRKTVIEERPVPEGSHIFLDVTALLGTQGQNQREKPVRVVCYRVDHMDYYVATDRFDLSAEVVALTYKLRWDIEIFFGWWNSTSMSTTWSPAPPMV